MTSQLYLDWWLYKHVFYSLISITVKILTMGIICVRISAITASVSLMFSKIFDNASFPIHDVFFSPEVNKIEVTVVATAVSIYPSVLRPHPTPCPHGHSLNCSRKIHDSWSGPKASLIELWQLEFIDRGHTSFFVS